MSIKMAIIENNNDEYADEPLNNLHTKNLKILQIKALLSKMQEYFYYLHLFLTFAIFTSIVIRIIWVIAEYLAQSTLPVTKDFLEIFKNAFNFNVVTLVLLVISLITLAMLWHTESYKEFFKTLSYPVLFGYITVLFVIHFVQFDESRFSNQLHIRNSFFFDYGSSMAYSYFHGYLEIIGPTHGDQRKGITERLENYEDIERVYVPVKQLFIIIPMTSYIPTQLSEGTGGRLNPSNSLQKLTIDRAGVKNRTYENMVYRISGPNRWYVCAEGATPVLTLNEALKYEPNMEYLKHEILIKFYHTLKYIINKHEKTRNKFEVILYNENENLGDVLERRIGELLKRDM